MMSTTKLCMRYDTCRRCPKNKECEAEFKKQQEIHSKSEQKKGESV